MCDRLQLRRGDGYSPDGSDCSLDASRRGRRSISTATASDRASVANPGGLVEKKGFDVLIKACAQLSFPFRLRIVGEGPQRTCLERLVAGFGVEEHVMFCGAKTHAELPDEYSRAHVVAAPSIIDSSGDRDGLPNVVLEAMASGRAVIASDVSAISSAIVNEETGLLVPPGDPLALAAALERVAISSSLCAELGRRARKRVEQDYEVGRCTERFCNFLESVYA
jgi:glycosyltransferase involved in cell wall biosynthesis